VGRSCRAIQARPLRKALANKALIPWYERCFVSDPMNVSLYTAASALNANMRWQEAIAENLSASSVPGYKKWDLTVTSANAGVNPTGMTEGSGAAFELPKAYASTSFTPGEFKYTGNNTDLAVEGSAFFEVQLPDGSLAYTRDGEFRLDAEGRLVTKQGFGVMGDNGGIQFDPASGSMLDSISIAATGAVSQAGEARGQLRIVEFNDPARLTPVSGGFFVAQQPGLQEINNPTSTLRQGWIEQSNASVVTEMASLLTAMRAFETNQRVIQLQDERMGRVISELTPN